VATAFVLFCLAQGRPVNAVRVASAWGGPCCMCCGAPESLIHSSVSVWTLRRRGLVLELFTVHLAAGTRGTCGCREHSCGPGHPRGSQCDLVVGMHHVKDCQCCLVSLPVLPCSYYHSLDQPALSFVAHESSTGIGPSIPGPSQELHTHTILVQAVLWWCCWARACRGRGLWLLATRKACRIYTRGTRACMLCCWHLWHHLMSCMGDAGPQRCIIVGSGTVPTVSTGLDDLAGWQAGSCRLCARDSKCSTSLCCYVHGCSPHQCTGMSVRGQPSLVQIGSVVLLWGLHRGRVCLCICGLSAWG